MENLIKLHLDAYYDAHYEEYKHSAFYKIDEDKAASKSAEITEQIAIEFWLWMRENDTPKNSEMYVNFTDKDMFQEFLKTMQ